MSDATENIQRFCCDGLCKQGRECPERKDDGVKTSNRGEAAPSRLPKPIEPERFLGPFVLIIGAFLVTLFILFLFYLAYTS